MPGPVVSTSLRLTITLPSLIPFAPQAGAKEAEPSERYASREERSGASPRPASLRGAIRLTLLTSVAGGPAPRRINDEGTEERAKERRLQGI